MHNFQNIEKVQKELVIFRVLNSYEFLMYYENMAVITGKMTYLFGTEKIKQNLRFTQIFGNYNGQWKRTAFQGTYIKNVK